MPFLVHHSNIKPIAQIVRIHDSLPSRPKGTFLLRAMLDVTYQIQSHPTAPLQASSWPKILKQKPEEKEKQH